MSVKHFLKGDGFVERLDVFGDDLTVVNAARVSFAKESSVLSMADEKLIRYLARNNHITPFFHPQVRFRLRMPIFVAREWFRHTVGFSRNEVSRRYVDSKPSYWKPVDALRLRDKSVKQGSKDELHARENEILGRWCKLEAEVTEFYEELLGEGIAPEIARGILPQSMHTEFIETGSLYAYARLCKLRLDPHAQKEIREYAERISACLESHFPVSWKYLMEGWSPAVAPAPGPTDAYKKMIELGVDTEAIRAAMIKNNISEAIAEELLGPVLPPLERSDDVITIKLSDDLSVGYIGDECKPYQIFPGIGHFGHGC